MFLYSFLGAVWGKMNSQYKAYAVIGFSILLSSFLSYFIYKMEKIAYAVSGMFFGCIVGLILYIVTGIYNYSSGSNLILYGTVLVFGSIFALGAIFSKR